MRPKTSMRLSMGVLTLALATLAQAAPCPPDSVQVGATCVDKYEASVWSIPATNKALITKVKKGRASLADLTKSGATQHGTTGDDYPCADTGNDCKDQIYAVSIPGVLPSTSLTWFQAAVACANAGQRLLTNQEWQVAALGTPTPTLDNGSTDCNTASAFTAVNTGSRANCQSAWGTFDMVGNVDEWVADWVPRSTTCGSWDGFSNDAQCFAGAATTGPPGALVRGGIFFDGSNAGVFSVDGIEPVSGAFAVYGFRCGR